MTSRRTYLTRAVAGLSAVMGITFGTGAFARTEADREFDLQIAADDNALLALEPSGVESSVVSTTDDGRELLQFDSGSTGLSPQATATVGRFEWVDFDDPGELLEEAFLIRNNTEEPIDVTVDIDVDANDAKVKFALSETDPSEGAATDFVTATGESPGTVESLSVDGEVYCGIVIETMGTETVDTEVDISAERNRGDHS